MPWLYQKYVGHDNNRDGYMQTQKETEVVNRLLFAEWLPQIMYNQHQGTYPPRIFVPPFPDPVNPNIDPQIVRGVDLVGGAMQDRFEREGKDGVISRFAFSIWYNGSVRHDQLLPQHHRHPDRDGPRVGHAVHVRPGGLPADALERGLHARAERDLSQPMARRHAAPARRGRVHADRFAGVLEVASKYRERFLYGSYQVGSRQIEKGRTDAPVAYVVPAAQHDVPAAMAFLGTLMKGGVEVHRAAAPFIAGEVTYPAGTHVVLLAQPFRAFAKDLLERQSYPGPARATPVDRRSRRTTPPGGRSRTRWESLRCR